MSERIGPGSMIAGRYQVDAQIGSGGMATVFRAEDIQLGRKVAVKVLHPQYSEDQEFVERFRREAKAAAQLQHPGIVSVYDTGSWNGTWYIAMELLEGPTLKERLIREGRIAPAEAITLTEHILRAVRAAHRDGIIHRDIKPHNVILDDDGRPKVTDFGIARRGASDMTATGSVLGTAHYIAPEQAQGEVITPRTDLYAVGVVLYEMLTGRTPFEGDSAVAIALAHVNNEPRSPRSIVPEISPALDAVVMRSLAKRPADRFPDADAFLAALGDAARGIAPVFTPPIGEQPTIYTPAVPRAGAPRPLEPAAPSAAGRPWWQRPWAIGLWALIAIVASVTALLLTSAPRVAVPDVVGLSLQTAQTRLNAAGFDVAVEQRASERVADTVLSQRPGGSAEAKKGSTVRLIVSSGAGTATVPQVDGEELALARDRLEVVGFRTRVRKQDSEEVEKGRVIETSPPGGSLAQLDEVVTIVVSTGPKAVVLPDVVRQPEDAAITALEELGLTVRTVEKESADSEPGTVLAMSPAAGSTARVGDRVTITVAAEPTTATIPDLTGRTQAVATRRLEALGFTVRVQVEATTDAAEDGRVISTDPAAGQEAELDSTVTIVVGALDDETDPTSP